MALYTNRPCKFKEAIPLTLQRNQKKKKRIARHCPGPPRASPELRGTDLVERQQRSCISTYGVTTAAIPMIDTPIPDSLNLSRLSLLHSIFQGTIQLNVCNSENRRQDKPWKRRSHSSTKKVISLPNGDSICMNLHSDLKKL